MKITAIAALAMSALALVSVPASAAEKKSPRTEEVPCSSVGIWNPFSTCTRPIPDAPKEKSTKPRVKKVDTALAQTKTNDAVSSLKSAKKTEVEKELQPVVLVTMESPDDDPLFLTDKDVERAKAELHTCTASAPKYQKVQCSNITIGAVVAEFLFKPTCLESDLCTSVIIIQKWCRSLKGGWGMVDNKHVCDAPSE